MNSLKSSVYVKVRDKMYINIRKFHASKTNMIWRNIWLKVILFHHHNVKYKNLNHLFKATLKGLRK